MTRYIDIDMVEYLIAHYGGMVTWNKKEILGEIRKQAQIHSTADVAPKSEVVREIFEEINEALTNLEYHIQSPRKTIKIEELKDQVDWILHEVVPKTLAELKKKYEEPKT